MYIGGQTIGAVARHVDDDVLGSTPNLYSEPGEPRMPAASRAAERAPLGLLVGAGAYALFALAWSATGRNDLDHAQAAVLAAATGSALSLVMGVLMASSQWRHRSMRPAGGLLVAACACVAASSIAACYVVLQQNTIAWRPRPLSSLEAVALALLFAAGILGVDSTRFDEHRLNNAVDAIVSGLGLGTCVVLFVHGVIPGDAQPWSVAVTALGLGIGIAIIMTMGRNQFGSFGAGLGAVAAVWGSTLVIQDLGKAAPSAGWIAFGRWLIPLAAFGLMAASSELSARPAIRRRTLGPSWLSLGPWSWIVPIAIGIAAAVARRQDASIWRDLALCSAIAAALLILRQAVLLRFERRRVLQLIDLSSELERVANIDGVTGIPNRTALDVRLEQEMERAIRYRQPVSICCVDIDLFKQVNDVHGHATGDVALRAIANVLQSTGRSIDFVARAGGEEFVVIAPGTWSADALVFGERMRAQVESLQLESRRGQPVPLTISVGIAGYPEHGNSGALLLERADEALYVSKELGRNRVTLWQTATED